MAIQQTKKQSDLEKRLRLLRQQVYGKDSEEFRKTRHISVSGNQIIRNTDSSDTQSHSESIRSDITYLYQDLLKISIFSALALGIQIILFILLKNHTLNLNFF